MSEFISLLHDWLWVLMGLGLVGLFILSRFKDAVANWLMAVSALVAFAIFTGFLGFRVVEFDLILFTAIPIVMAAVDFGLTLFKREPHDGSVDDILGDKDIA